MPRVEPTSQQPPYPVGLRLAGRRVVVVGGGSVAQRRVPVLIEAGARVVVVSPRVTPALEGMADEVTLVLREFTESDLDETWYAIAATDRPDVNARVLAAADERRVFCVRADDAREASAWTMASGRHGQVTVAVLGNREPRQSAALRDDIVEALRDGRLTTAGSHDHAPGVVLVGGGPGDPALVTVAARQALAAADVVVADRLAPRALLDELSADVELVDVAKLPRGRAALQEQINAVLVDRARAGKRVVRFMGGDSFVFGRGFEEVLACRAADVPVRVVPGLPSPVAVTGAAGIPLTHRGVAHDFTVVSGHLPPGHPDSLVRWESLAGLDGTLVLMMAVDNAAAIAAELVRHGRSAATPAAVVSDGTMPDERTVLATLGTLGERIAEAGVRPPAIIVVGEVVAVARPDAFAGE
jgi:uroporphyrin-III C-methyltransferase/precorrin-2 dehydrogenase/sirohydrochlorin ferrochelatase